jgi:hypothetical protein
VGGSVGALAQQPASDAESSFRLLDVDGPGKHQVRTHAVGFGDTGLALDQADGERPMIEAGIAGAFHEKGRALFVLAVDDDGVIVLRHQTFYGGKRLIDWRNGKLKFTEELTYDPGEFLIRAIQ